MAQDIINKIRATVAGTAVDTGALREYHPDNLYEALEAMKINNMDDLVVAETLMRIIKLREPSDGWFRSHIGDWPGNAYEAVLDGEGAISRLNGRLIYTEDATPDGTFGVGVSIPNQWKARLQEMSVNLADQDAGVQIIVIHKDSNNGYQMELLIDQTLDNQNVSMRAERVSNAQFSVPHLYARDSSSRGQIHWYSAAEIDASTACSMTALIDFRRTIDWDLDMESN